MDVSTNKKYLQYFVCGQMSYYEISAKMITVQLAAALKHRASKIRLQASKVE